MTSKIYTKTGDKGLTSLVGGSRISKSDLRVETYGTVDEATSAIGSALSMVCDAQLSRDLEFAMHKLFSCASNIACPAELNTNRVHITAADIRYLEEAIDRMDQAAGPIVGFVLPTGTQAASMLHLARTVCRRAERRLASLAEREAIDSDVFAFINRASDFLFAAARYANFIDGIKDTHWNKQLTPPND